MSEYQLNVRLFSLAYEVVKILQLMSVICMQVTDLGYSSQLFYVLTARCDVCIACYIWERP